MLELSRALPGNSEGLEEIIISLGRLRGSSMASMPSRASGNNYQECEKHRTIPDSSQRISPGLALSF